MSRIQIADLPALQDLSPEELELIFGAGPQTFRPTIDSLEDRLLLSGGLSLGHFAAKSHPVHVTVHRVTHGHRPNVIHKPPAPVLATSVGSSDAYWSPILGAYQRLGGQGGVLGSSTSAELTIPGGKVQHFQHGDIFWSAATGAHEVHGAIGAKYAQLGGPASFLGFPTGDEAAGQVSGSRYNFFQNGRIYWSAATGAHEVHGAILQEYGQLGGSGSILGLPTSDEVAGGAGSRVSYFQDGAISWSPRTGTVAIKGDAGAIQGIINNARAMASGKDAQEFPVLGVLGNDGRLSKLGRDGVVFLGTVTHSQQGQPMVQPPAATGLGLFDPTNLDDWAGIDPTNPGSGGNTTWHNILNSLAGFDPTNHPHAATEPSLLQFEEDTYVFKLFNSTNRDLRLTVWYRTPDGSATKTDILLHPGQTWGPIEVLNSDELNQIIINQAGVGACILKSNNWDPEPDPTDYRYVTTTVTFALDETALRPDPKVTAEVAADSTIFLPPAF
jgi:hypothetical protein